MLRLMLLIPSRAHSVPWAGRQLGRMEWPAIVANRQEGSVSERCHPSPFAAHAGIDASAAALLSLTSSWCTPHLTLLPCEKCPMPQCSDLSLGLVTSECLLQNYSIRSPTALVIYPTNCIVCLGLLVADSEEGVAASLKWCISLENCEITIKKWLLRNKIPASAGKRASI